MCIEAIPAHWERLGYAVYTTCVRCFIVDTTVDSKSDLKHILTS